MDSSTPALPLEYDAAFEFPEHGEAETRDELVKTLLEISATTYEDSGHATRSVHAKSHGLIRAELHVPEDLPAHLAQGIFSRPGTLPAVMRLSTVPGDVLDDSISTPRGLAVKIVGVQGDRLEGSQGEVTQDFVLVNGGSTFPAATAKKFLGNLKLLAPTTDRAPGLKKALSAVFQVAEKAVEAFGKKSATLISLGGHPQTHILGESFFSKVPILFGPYMAKLMIVPVSAELVALTNAPLNVNGKPNGLRDAVIDFFATHGGVWEIRVQLCTDVQKMPIEEASVEWPEELSPYVAVARITARAQVAWSEARSAFVDDRMSFSPWHGIAAHRPLGSIMRVRKMAYQMSAKFRAERTGGALIEPASIAAFPD